MCSQAWHIYYRNSFSRVYPFNTGIEQLIRHAGWPADQNKLLLSCECVYVSSSIYFIAEAVTKPNQTNASPRSHKRLRYWRSLNFFRPPSGGKKSPSSGRHRWFVQVDRGTALWNPRKRGDKILRLECGPGALVVTVVVVVVWLWAPEVHLSTVRVCYLGKIPFSSGCGVKV